MSVTWVGTPNKFVYGFDFGPDGADYIDASFMDTFGNSIAEFVANGGPDYIGVDAGYGNDGFNYYSDPLSGEDTMEVHGNEGDDYLSISAGEDFILSGDEGDDVLSVWFSGNEEEWLGGAVTMIGGEGSDVFEVASFGPGGTVAITDFDVGTDSIVVINEGEAWETIDFSLGGPGGRFVAVETADGVELTIRHYIEWGSDNIDLWTDVATITLLGVELADLTGAVGGNYLSGTPGRDIFRTETLDADGDGLTGLSDTIDAGAGNDNIRLDTSNDVILAGTGNDYVLVRGSGNIIDGGAGNDQILTRWGGNTVNGGDGNDRITVDLRSGGEFSLAGGYGEDTFVFTNAQAKAATYTEITDFDVFNDTLIIGGVEIDFSNLPDNFEVTDNGTSMLLEFGRNDSILVTFDIYPM